MRYLLLVLLLFVGCSGTLYQRVTTDKGPVYVGMSAEMIEAVMGPPDEVGQGPWGCKYVGKFFGLSVRRDSVAEWAWQEPAGILVAYLHRQQVQYLGIVKR